MADESRSAGTIVPKEHQEPLPIDRFLLREEPGDEAVPMDVVFVGAGPAGLAGALELARLVDGDDEVGDVEIAVLEKSEGLGEHCLSGAVVNPRPFRELFPDTDVSELPFRRPVEEESVHVLTESGSYRIPTPPTMKNHGNWVASICEIVRWMGERAEEAGVNLFTGFPADGLLVDGDAVRGVRTTPSGLERSGEPGAGYMPPTDIAARAVVLSEGTRGSLSQAFYEWQGIGSGNPQIYALGVKELWETEVELDRVVHTMGWPLPGDAFGGSWMYPMEPNLLSLGLVVGLDYPELRLDVHQLLQKMKLHPFFRRYLEGGELVEWGGKTIPEGGHHSLPERFHGDGIVVTGDAAGFVDVPSLKGIHYAVQSGIYAARAVFRGLKADAGSDGPLPASALSAYDRMIRESYIAGDLHRTRNMRLAFKDGFVAGGVKSALMTVTRGAFPGGRIEVEEDAATPRIPGEGVRFDAGSELTIRKLDAVFESGNQTRDDIPSHLEVGDEVPAELAEFYEHMCPAGVYEREDGELVVNAPNCIDCKATDVLGPRWTPREGGSGPRYRRM